MDSGFFIAAQRAARRRVGSTLACCARGGVMSTRMCTCTRQPAAHS